MTLERRRLEARTPNFFIVGAPKSGTTSMWAYLRAHPEVHMPRRKEPERFGSDLEFSTPRITHNQYLALFSGARDEKRIGEASVWYLYSERAAAEIKEFAPEAVIIIMLRNPTDMIHSLHHEAVYQGNEDIPDFESALEAEVDRRNGLRKPRLEVFPQAVFYRQVGSYAAQVRRYLDLFGRPKVHVILFDDLARNPAAVYAETLRFLGVDPRVTIEFPVVNPSKGPRSQLVHRLLHEPPPPWVRRVVRTLVPQRARLELGNAVNHANMKRVPRPPMDTRLRQELVAFFAPDIEELEVLIERDLSSWRQVSPNHFDSAAAEESSL